MALVPFFKAKYKQPTSSPYQVRELKLAEPADKTYRLFQYKTSPPLHSTGPPAEIEYALDVHVLQDFVSAASVVFQSMNEKSRWAESNQKTVELPGDDITAMRLWLGVLHNKPEYEIDSNPVPLETLWDIVQVTEKYHADRHSMSPWFKVWYEKNLKALQEREYFDNELIYPCFAFNHAEGFAEHTRSLAYNSAGHIEERNPTELRYIHLKPKVICMQPQFFVLTPS
jgi:hypothetical protein